MERYVYIIGLVLFAIAAAVCGNWAAKLKATNNGLIERNTQIMHELRSIEEGARRTAEEVAGYRDRERERSSRERAIEEREKQIDQRERERLDRVGEILGSMLQLDSETGRGIETIRAATDRIEEIIQALIDD